ncbi:hypothetical protein CHLRE_03g185350v5 [Chlamydomonas reinhardtii]|uniref:1,3-beta-glucan synthase n=1 Tax=Chlamydomonas reinhardtii TaxID=3055 RepID=A0A2K3DY17_CHLRE|nr:uncharacterized protein CHLRE_03g185350v5 [Chlamydomonas reinhardtii]PNW85415.1 hypothetical protein CHLRE_03g185350v5 [Chlamydomonas reinhardtii]
MSGTDAGPGSTSSRASQLQELQQRAKSLERRLAAAAGLHDTLYETSSYEYLPPPPGESLLPPKPARTHAADPAAGNGGAPLGDPYAAYSPLFSNFPIYHSRPLGPWAPAPSPTGSGALSPRGSSGGGASPTSHGTGASNTTIDWVTAAPLQPQSPSAPRPRPSQKRHAAALTEPEPKVRFRQPPGSAAAVGEGRTSSPLGASTGGDGSVAASGSSTSGVDAFIPSASVGGSNSPPPVASDTARTQHWLDGVQAASATTLSAALATPAAQMSPPPASSDSPLCRLPPNTSYGRGPGSTSPRSGSVSRSLHSVGAAASEPIHGPQQQFNQGQHHVHLHLQHQQHQWMQHQQHQQRQQGLLQHTVQRAVWHQGQLRRVAPHGAPASFFPFSSSPKSAIPYVPALPPPSPRPLPESTAAVARRPLGDRIQNTTWALARAFGFQAFNEKPSAAPHPAHQQQPRQWVPSTAFVAADHLEALLLRNIMPRHLAAMKGGGAGDPAAAAGGDEPQREAAFACAVWELHSHIFLSYEGAAGWCRLLGLRPRLAEVEAEVLQAPGRTAQDPAVVSVLLLELCLYFLLYSEAANLRHTPELLWFLFWAAAHSDTMQRLCRNSAALTSPASGPGGLQLENARQRRLAMRNTLQSALYTAQRYLDHDPAACRPEVCVEAATTLAAQLPGLLPRLNLPGPPASAGPSSSSSPTKGRTRSAADEQDDAALSCAASRSLFVDLASFGDGGFWTDVVVAPLFTVLAYEVDACSAAGQESAFRLGYDDVNESLCRRDVLSRLLAELGVQQADAAAGTVHGALDAITRLGYPPSVAVGGAAVATGPDGTVPPADADAHGHSHLRRRHNRSSGGGASPTFANSATPAISSSSHLDLRAFDVDAAAAFWLDRVFIKTHRERRSWSAIFRAFYRVFSLQLVLLHLTIAHAFAPFDLAVLSSAVVTHALVQAAERAANWWLSRGTHDPLQRAKARESWVSASPEKLMAAHLAKTKAGKKGKQAQEAGEDVEASGGSSGTAAEQQQSAAAAGAAGGSRLTDAEAVAARLERRRAVAVEGAPVWGVCGWLEWVIVAAGITGLFALQHIGPPALAVMAKSYWPFAVAGYAVAVVGHGLATGRDGYSISLSSALRLPAALRASSARPRAECWLPGHLGVGWRAALLTALFWLQVLGAKLAFDYFIIMRPMAGQVRFILHRNWLGCPAAQTHYRLFGAMALPLACADGDWLLVVLRVAPFVLVCLVDTQIFYQLVLMAWGLVQGLQAMNLGIAGSWEALVAEFHRAPVRWWARCMSAAGNQAARAAAAASVARRQHAITGIGSSSAAAAGGARGSEGRTDDEYGSSSGGDDDGDNSEYDSEFEYGSVYGGAGSSKRGGLFGRRSGSASSLHSSSLHDCAPSPGPFDRRPGTAGVAGPQRGPRPSRPPHRRSPSPAPSAALAAAASSSGTPTSADATSADPSAETIVGRNDRKRNRDGKGKAKGGKARDAGTAAELVAMLSGQGEEQIAQWMAFAVAWDAVVEDLRRADLISDREQDNLMFTRLPAAATLLTAALPPTAAGTALAAAGFSPDSPSAAAAAPGRGSDSVSGDSVGAGSSGGSSNSTAAGGGPSSSRPLRPILLPAFFYAGQVQRAVDSGAASPAQALVLGELRSALVWLGCQLRLLDGRTAAVLLDAPSCSAAIDPAHGRAREAGLAALRRLAAALTGLSEPLPAAGSGTVGEALRRRHGLASEAQAALDDVLVVVEVEARAVIKSQLAASRKGSKKGGRKDKTAAAVTGPDAQPAPAEGAKAASAEEAAAAAADPQVAALEVLQTVESLRTQLKQHPAWLAGALALLHPEGRGCGDVHLPSASSLSSAAASPGSGDRVLHVSVELPLLRRVLGVVSKMLSLSSAAAQPSGAEARRILSFFVTSLANRQLGRPDTVAATPSWTVLTPLYAEDVLFPLEARATAEALGLPMPRGDPAAAAASDTAPHPSSHVSSPAGTGALPDLLTETEERVSLMAYLRSMFPKDWENFKERLGAELGGVQLAAATEADFAAGGPLAEHGLALQLWASYRGQLLARTVRGMAAYGSALRVLAALEAPRPPCSSRRQHAAEVEDVVGGKFCHVVASQLYGRHRRSPHLRERWLAESTDVLLQANPHMRVSYLDVVHQGPKQGKGQQHQQQLQLPQHFAVLIRGRQPGSEGRWESFQSHGGAGSDAGGVTAGGAVRGASRGRTEELYRVRLPTNRFSSRGVILGEGKPENQNHAVIFCFGEALQTIDMNQDNALAEALKMRNLLKELRPEAVSRPAQKAAAALQEAVALAAADGLPASHRVGSATSSSADTGGPSGAAAASGAVALPAASEYRRLLSELRNAERPVAVAGFREWIFSDKAGALGAFAASAEFAFGTIVQRTMAYPAAVRLHYGHPDLFNKIFVMTRGGLSKATRQLHVSEDIFGGMNHTLRGGQIKYREYISCGKGRDMGFDSINAFEAKISSGFGEVSLSRDLLRLATRVDLWRCLHLYHSLVGNYINTWLVMGSVYAHIYALVFFALAQAAVYRVFVYYPSPPPPPPGTPLVPVGPAGAPPPPAGTLKEVLAYDTIRVEHVLQLGLLSLLPYIAEVALEQGLVRALLAALAQLVSGSFSFFIFKQQTTAASLHSSVMYGGASYIATGRGFSITSSSFLNLFANYGRSHMALGFELAALAIALAATNDCARCSYGGLTWGTWLAAVSLVFAPCWFNPMAFSPAKVRRDMHAFAAWLRGEVDKELGCTWAQWHRRQLAPARGEAAAGGGQTDRWLNVLQNLMLRAFPPALLTVAAASRLNLRLDKLPGLPAPLRSASALFLIASAGLWAVLISAMGASRRFAALSDRRRWRLWSFWVGVSGVSCAVLFLVGLSRWYSGSGLSNLCLLVYANALLATAVHRGLEAVAPRSWTGARRLVDGGHMLLDCCVGWAVLGMLGALSLLGFVGRVQTMLLFNVTFARSVKRGSLVKTIGTAKTGGGQQQGTTAIVGMVLDQGDAAGAHVGEAEAEVAGGGAAGAGGRTSAVAVAGRRLRTGGRRGSIGPDRV